MTEPTVEPPEWVSKYGKEINELWEKEKQRYLAKGATLEEINTSGPRQWICWGAPRLSVWERILDRVHQLWQGVSHEKK